MRVSADNKSITIDLQMLPLPPIRGDAGRLKQVLCGLGLGLAIARQLVALHGGTIQARNDGPPAVPRS